MRALCRLRWLSGVLLWALALAAQASVLVLVPGYLEGGDSWRDTGVAAGLSRAGLEGVTKALEVLHRELDISMAFCGHRDIANVSRDILHVPQGFSGNWE